MSRQHQINLGYRIAALLLLMLFQSCWQGITTTERIPWSRFIELLEADRIAAVQVHPERIVGRYREPIECRTRSNAAHTS